MSETNKVLGQLNVPATTLSSLYTVPSSTSAVISTLSICNRNSSNVSVRVSIAVSGAVDDVKQYILYDYIITKNDSAFFTLGLTLSETDVVRVYASTTGVSFNLFGVEVS